MAAMLSTANGNRRKDGAGEDGAGGAAPPSMDGAPLDKSETAYLLGLARRTVRGYLEKGQRPQIREQEIPSGRMIEERACFVTIYLDGRLRGCIGSLEPQRPLVLDVIENSLGSAFEDPRFRPVSPEEFGRLRFSISVLSLPRMIRPAGPEELLGALEPGRHGLTIKKGHNRATFLPVVWEIIPDKVDFLRRLCLKAGLMPDEWRKTASMRFYTYEAQEFSE